MAGRLRADLRHGSPARRAAVRRRKRADPAPDLRQSGPLRSDPRKQGEAGARSPSRTGTALRQAASVAATIVLGSTTSSGSSVRSPAGRGPGWTRSEQARDRDPTADIRVHFLLAFLPVSGLPRRGAEECEQRPTNMEYMSKAVFVERPYGHDWSAGVDRIVGGSILRSNGVSCALVRPEDALRGHSLLGGFFNRFREGRWPNSSTSKSAESMSKTASSIAMSRYPPHRAAGSTDTRHCLGRRQAWNASPTPPYRRAGRTG